MTTLNFNDFHSRMHILSFHTSVFIFVLVASLKIGKTRASSVLFSLKHDLFTIYDLQGRKVENPTKGLYIVNGKKVVIK